MTELDNTRSEWYRKLNSLFTGHDLVWLGFFAGISIGAAVIAVITAFSGEGTGAVLALGLSLYGAIGVKREYADWEASRS